MFRPVDELVHQGGGVALGVAEALKGRHLHIVGALGIKDARAAVADIGTSYGKEPVSVGKPLLQGKGGSFGPDV